MEFIIDPVNSIASWLEGLLLGLGLAPIATTVIIKLLGAAILGAFGLGLVIFLIWFERKIYARIQDRLGPNRVGPWGILQTFPDMIKIFTKEYITPDGVDKILYNLAPILVVSGVLLAWAVIPLSSTLVGSSVNVGVLYLVAVGAISTLGIIMAGWSSNNKYSLLGAFRTVSQLVAYEVPMVLALLIPVLLTYSMDVSGIVDAQVIWYVVYSPIAALIFFLSAIAETGRAPFDLLEAESELVAGYQTEYSGLKFGMFFVGEFLHAFTISALTVALFLGGWRGPGSETWPILGTIYFFIKSFIVYFIVLWVRISLPRLRIDQMLNFNWKFLTPIALVLLITTAIVEKYISMWLPTLNLSNSGEMIARVGIHFSVDIVIFIVVVLILRSFGSKERKRVADPRPIAVAPEPPVSEVS
jgi:NADH-quinone oxidoreductase subunit H